ncbi:MAG: ABC transporter permease [Lachnospiraceae bacterium]|jgi:rhamnose transport system permease protein|nr:ABC transporter permease [Lachnospiraceae bacterium]
MAGKSGRSISATPQNAFKSSVLSWEGFLVVLFIAVNIFCVFLSPNYKVTNVLREMPKYLAEVFIMFPMAYILIMGEIDISVGSIVCLSATLTCLASNAGVPLGLAIILCIIIGIVCGFINGLVKTSFPELPTMIITLATQIIFRGIAEIALGNGGSVSLKDTKGFKVLAGKIGPVPYVFILVLIAAIIFAIVLHKTTFGRKLYAIGSNRVTAQYSGIHVNKIILICYTLAGLMAGICALFLTSVLYGANTTTGNGFEMDVIAMAVFGGVSTLGGKGKMPGAIISAFIIMCLRIGLGLINMNPQIILIILGALLIIAVLLPNIIAMIGNARKVAEKR